MNLKPKNELVISILYTGKKIKINVNSKSQEWWKGSKRNRCS